MKFAILERVNSRFKRLKRKLTLSVQLLHSINAYPRRADTPVILTRVYIFLMLIVFLTVLLITGLDRNNELTTIMAPSENEFDILDKKYRNQGLSCPCTRVSITYETFSSVSVEYHQICSSSYVQSYWWTLLVDSGDVVRFRDRPLLGAYFRMLSSLCSVAKQTIANAIQNYASSTFVSVETFGRDFFQNEIDSYLNRYIKQIPSKFVRTHKFITETFRSNQIQDMFMSAWRLIFTTAEENFIIGTMPVLYENGTCTCATSLNSNCSRKLTFFLPNLTTTTLPQLRGSCSVVNGLRLSSIECFYDQLCLNKVANILNMSITLEPLNSSLETRFPINRTLIGEIMEELFIERWINTTNYSSYYQACSPRYCQHTIQTHNSVLFMIMTLLGLYGGLTITIQFVVLHCWFVTRGLKNWWSFNFRRTHRIPKSN